MKHAIVIALLLTSSIAHAEFTVAAGADIAFDAGRPYAEIRYLGEDWKHWSAWVGTDRSIGAEVYTTLFGIQLGLGIENANEKAGNKEIVSTSWAYQLRFEYSISERWGVGVKHRSNCKQVCNNDVLGWLPHGEYKDWNHGFNFLYLRHRF